MKLLLPAKASVVRIGRVTRIPKNLVNKSKLRQQLTVTNGAYWSAVANGSKSDLPPELVLFKEDERFFYVPRNYRVPWNCRPVVVHHRFVDTGIRVPHSIVLRTKNEIQTKASEALLKNNNDKIISIACGGGKSVITLFSLSEGFRFPALIVVPTEALLSQWKREIRRFYGMTDDDIGHVQAGIEDWKGKKVAVAMLHSLVLKDYSKEFYNYWRCVIYDELHRLGSNLFAKAAPMFPAERWGLSATVERGDGMEKVFKLHVGEVAYQNLTQDMKSTVYFVKTGIKVDTRQFSYYRGKINLPQLLTWLSENEERNKLISHYLDKAIRDDRKLLVLGERRRNLYDLCDALSATDSKMVYVGTSKKSERTEREAKLVTKSAIFATQQLAKEGLDKKELDTLFILATFGAKGRLQQSVGRIERICEGKKRPNVIIFEDNISIINSLGNKMRAWFKLNNYPVKEVRGSFK